MHIYNNKPCTEGSTGEHISGIFAHEGCQREHWVSIMWKERLPSAIQEKLAHSMIHRRFKFLLCYTLVDWLNIEVVARSKGCGVCVRCVYGVLYQFLVLMDWFNLYTKLFVRLLSYCSTLRNKTRLVFWDFRYPLRVKISTTKRDRVAFIYYKLSIIMVTTFHWD